MKRRHVAFICEPAYGHIVPTLGMASELVRRGYHVSYAVSKEYAVGVEKIGAEAMIYHPLDAKVEVRPKLLQYKGHDRGAFANEMFKEFVQREFETALSQLREIYRNKAPDIIVYDLRNLAGKSLAQSEGVAKIEHSPMAIENCGKANIIGGPYDEEVVLISLPKLFQRGAESLDHRFRFTGFCSDGRELFFNTWSRKHSGEDTILVAGTTAGSCPEFFQTAISALKELPCRVVLSLAHTCVSSLGPLPPNFEINPRCSNFEILRQCRLYIGQGGQGSTLEALYWGVPVILIPPNKVNHTFIGRVVDQGLGFHLEPSEASAETVQRLALLLLNGGDVRQRVEAVRDSLQLENGSRSAADLIEEHV